GRRPPTPGGPPGPGPSPPPAVNTARPAAADGRGENASPRLPPCPRPPHQSPAPGGSQCEHASGSDDQPGSADTRLLDTRRGESHSSPSPCHRAIPLARAPGGTGPDGPTLHTVP